MLSGQNLFDLRQADGVASLRLRFPQAVWHWPGLQLILEQAEQLARSPSVELLTVESTHPSGFCRGTATAALSHADDRLRYAKQGQDLLSRWVKLPIPTLALLHGNAVGPGWELALACDYRLMTTGPHSWVGWPVVPPTWGGRSWASRLATRSSFQRLLNGERLTAREALQAKLLDDAFTDRRRKVETRHWFNNLKKTGFKRTRLADGVELAEDRRRFRNWQPPETTSTWPEPLEFCGSVLVVGRPPLAANLAVELCLNGLSSSLVNGFDECEPAFQQALVRGRVTPLELEQARKLLNPMSSTADIVWFLDDRGWNWSQVQQHIGPRTVLLAPPAGMQQLRELDLRPDRQLSLSLDWQSNSVELVSWLHTNSATLNTVQGLLHRLNLSIGQMQTLPQEPEQTPKATNRTSLNLAWPIVSSVPLA